MNAEDIIQINVHEFAKHYKLPFFHFAGERQCAPAYGAFLKRKGSKAGVSDCFFPRGNGTFSGLWLELKSAKGKLSEHQIKFMSNMLDEGYQCHTAYSFDEAELMIRAFYSL